MPRASAAPPRCPTHCDRSRTCSESQDRLALLQLCALLALALRDLWTGVIVDVGRLMVEHANPLARLAGDELAGRLVHAPASPAALLRALSVADRATVQSHLVDEATLQALVRGDIEGFLSGRRAALDRHLRNHIARMASWGSDDSPSLASIAAEEDDEC